MLDWTTDRLLATETGRALVGRLMAEVMDAGRADGVTFGFSTAEMIERQLRLTATIGSYRTSMQIDRAEGRSMEIEAILGEPLRRARAGGAETPLLQTVYELARLIDSARLQPTAS